MNNPHNTDVNFLNQKITDLWNTTFENTNVLSPLFFDGVKKHQLLFIGMNPSFSDKEFKKYLKGTEFAAIVQHDLFKWNNVCGNEAVINQTIAIDRYAILHHPYFTKMRKLAEENNLAWQHFDMFFYRETNQAKFEKMILHKDELTEFGKQQIAILASALLLAEPKCIVMVNAKASELFRSYFSEHIQWDEEYGHHYLTLNDNSIPILFSSMLSGQRALDRWSFERLSWHLRYIVKHHLDNITQ